MALLTHNKTHTKKLDLQMQIILENPDFSQLRPVTTTKRISKNTPSHRKPAATEILPLRDKESSGHQN